METIPEVLDEPVFHHAFDLANRADMTPKELEDDDDSMTVMLDERGPIEGALEFGEKPGKKRGILQVALAMRGKQRARNLIAKVTGLTVKQIEASA